MGKVVENVFDSVGDAVSDILDFVGKDIVDDLFGLDSLGAEIGRWGEDIHQTLNVMSGQYASRSKDAQEILDRANSAKSRYTNDMQALADKMESLVAFPEIFKMAQANRMDRLSQEYLPQIEMLLDRYKMAIASIEKDFDFVIGLTQGAFIQRIVGSLIMAEGGLMSDIGDLLNGNGSSETWQRVITVIVLVIIIVFMWWNAGGWAAMNALQATAFVLTATAAFLTIDAMYAGGAAMGAVMSALDFAFNDLLNLDDFIGSDFDKFDKDHDDYQEMVMFTKLAISLAAIASSWANAAGNYSTAAEYGTAPWSEQTNMLAAQDAGLTTTASANTITSIMGIDTSTYSSIYSAYKTANSVYDLVTAGAAYEAMEDKFAEDRAKLDTIITNKYRKNFMKHYKDTAYFLQDQQEFIDRYIWGMTANSMYVDPYGTTPVANSRFTPDKDTRVMSFGFEDMFDESSSAGSKGYFNSIIYGN